MSLDDVGVHYDRLGKLYKKKKEGFWALSSVSFDLYHGEVLGVIGRNGVGKSTLLRILAGVIRPDKGAFVNHGYRASLLALQAGFLPHLSGRKNAILSGLLLGLKYREIEENMASMIAMAGVADFIDEPIKTYSSGMVARLGFSVAVHADPDVILIDEVLGVGDMQFKKQSSSIIKDRLKSGKTAVMVSHSIPVLKELCSRIVWIENGTTRMVGDVDTVLDEYQQFYA